MEALPLSEGWRRESDHLQLGIEPSTLAASLSHALEFPTLISGERSYEVLLRFRLPAQDSEPQMLVLAAGEIWAALGILPTAAKAFATLGSGAVEDAATEMRSEFERTMETFEASPACTVPGGIHELRLRFELRRTRVHVSLALEDRELARGDFPVQDRIKPTLRLIPLQGMQIFGLRLREL